MLLIKIMNISVYLYKHVNVRIRLNGYELNCCDVIVRGFLIEFVTITKFLIFSGLFFKPNKCYYHIAKNSVNVDKEL